MCSPLMIIFCPFFLGPFSLIQEPINLFVNMVTGPILSAVQHGVQSFGNPVEDFSVSGDSSMWITEIRALNVETRAIRRITALLLFV